MKSIVVIALLSQLSFAEMIGLEVLLESAKQPKQIEKMIVHKFHALESKSLADVQTSPLTYSQSLSASISPMESGLEFEVGFSKELKLESISELELKANRLENEASSVEEAKLLVNFSNRLKNSYHQYCLNRQFLKAYEDKYERFSQLYEKKNRAYEEDEISKIELFQIELEKDKLANKRDNFLQQVEDERKELLSFTSLGEDHRISCYEMYPIAPSSLDEKNYFLLTKQAYHKRIESTQTALKRHSGGVDTFELSTGYVRELDRDVYTIGISVPLTFSSKRFEYERASLMEHSSALSVENEQKIENKKYEIKHLKSKLHRIYKDILNEEENMLSFENKLLPLMKKSYDYGESTVMEYLLGQQQMSSKETALLEKKKEYYQTLFTLYNISEKR
jgi:hypothetical protein